jgi:hypothetical protein
MLARSTCNLRQQKHGVENVQGTHMEAPSMVVGMVRAEFQPNPPGVEIRSNDMATHEVPVVEEALPVMEGNVEM